MFKTCLAGTSTFQSMNVHLFRRSMHTQSSCSDVEGLLYKVRRPCAPRLCETPSHTGYARVKDANGVYSQQLSTQRKSVRAFGTLSVDASSKPSVSGRHGSVPKASKKAASALEEKQTDANIVLRKPIPRNFIRDTFLPHLEHNVAYNAHKFPPSVVLQIAIAYSKLPAFIRQRAIEDSIIETFIDRMVDYSAADCVQLLNTSLQLQGLRNLKVYSAILKRLKDKHVFGSITVLNRLGIVRSISRILQRAQIVQGDSGPIPLDVEMLDVKQYRSSILKPWSLITAGLRSSELKKLCSDLVDFGGDSLLPQLEFEMQSLDSYELSDILGVLGERTERDSAKLDFPIIAILMQRIIALNNETPLVNKLANVCSLCRLQVSHEQYLELVISDLNDPLKVNNIFHRHLARALWAFSRFQVLDRVFDALIPHMERNAISFEPSSMARLAQLYKAELDIGVVAKPMLERLRDVIVTNALHALSKVDKFTPKDLVFFYSGMCYFRLLPNRSDFESFISGRSSGVLKYRESEPQDFDAHLQAKGRTRTHFLESVIAAMERVENDFDLSEIQRVVLITKSMEHAKFVLDHLPRSWSRVVEESGDGIL